MTASLQDSSEYSCWSQQCYGLYCLIFFIWFQILLFFSKPLKTVSSTPTIISITVTFIFYRLLLLLLLLFTFFYSQFYFWYLTVLYLVYTQDLGWGQEVVIYILCIYPFCCFFWVKFFNPINNTLLKRWAVAQKLIFFILVWQYTHPHQTLEWFHFQSADHSTWFIMS